MSGIDDRMGQMKCENHNFNLDLQILIVKNPKSIG